MSEQIEGRRPVLEALRAGRPIDELLISGGSRSAGALAEIEKLAEASGVRIRRMPRRELDALAKTRNPQGVIAVGISHTYATLDDLFERARDETPLLVALDGVTDPQNLGALARSAEAAGAHGILFPRRRSAGITDAAIRASSGALEHIACVQVANLTRALEELKGRGVWIVGLDGSGERTIYELGSAADPICVVVGGEGAGLSRLVREHCDVVVRIPMRGRVESLNASAAGAIALFEIGRVRSL